MHDPVQKAAKRLMLAIGISIGVAASQAVQAAEDAPAVAEDAAGSAPGPVTVPLSGQKVYNEVCIACHSPPGVGGAPPLGDSTAWGPRIAQGKDTLFSHALNGYSGKTGVMPKKGGRLDLSDEEIIGGVEYMVGQAGH
jgi:cytochrome c5